ncbi:MAG TPA: three component ABC system middle component, partial [Stenomitos sp.]
IKFLKNGNVRPREAAALAAIRPDLILNFSERFYSGLPISLNAVQIVIAGGFASLDSEIRFERALQVDKSFGNRANDIVKAANNLAALLSSPVEELYLNLRVKL